MERQSTSLQATGRMECWRLGRRRQRRLAAAVRAAQAAGVSRGGCRSDVQVALLFRSGRQALPLSRCAAQGSPRPALALHVPGGSPVLDRQLRRWMEPTKCLKRRLALGM